jgi:hypothetical protein
MKPISEELEDIETLTLSLIISMPMRFGKALKIMTWRKIMPHF